MTLTPREYIMVRSLIDEDSIKGIAKLYREIVDKCYSLAVKYSLLTPREKHELVTLRNIASEIVSIWRMTPDEILVSAKEG